MFTQTAVDRGQFYNSHQYIFHYIVGMLFDILDIPQYSHNYQANWDKPCSSHLMCTSVYHNVQTLMHRNTNCQTVTPASDEYQPTEVEVQCVPMFCSQCNNAINTPTDVNVRVNYGIFSAKFSRARYIISL